MRSRATAEWATFALACAVVAVVVGLILLQVPGSDALAVPTAKVTGPPVQRADGFLVPVEVHNSGEATAQNVQIAAELKIGDRRLEADQVVDFLAGGETEQVQFVFAEDPARGSLTVRVTGYGVP